MSRKHREIPQVTHADSPFFYGMARLDKQQPMTEVIEEAVAGYQLRYGTETPPRFLVCHADLAEELGAEHAGMEVRPWGCVDANVVYVGANPPATRI